MTGKGVMPEELVELVAQLRAPGREEVILGCEGNRRAATIINRRFVKMRCTKTRCKRDDGAKVFHIWDLLTGRLVDNELEYDDGRVIRLKETRHGIRRNCTWTE